MDEGTAVRTGPPGSRLGSTDDRERPREGDADPRVVVHVDMDAFFAAVEVLDDPTLRGRPVIVGGAGRRGVVAACTYEARAYGVHSAMPSFVARRLCPHAVFVQGRHWRYVEQSERLHGVLEAVTPFVEGIALDEAFLDVTAARRLLGDPVRIAQRIRRDVHDQLGLTCSVGVAGNKLVAKLASEAAKPVATRSAVRPGIGVVVVPHGAEQPFLEGLPVTALWGVGPATAKRLVSYGITTVGALAATDPLTVRRLVGTTQGSRLVELANGRDPRPVVPSRPVVSMGRETTFPRDVARRHEVHAALAALVDRAVRQIRTAGVAARCVTVKVRFGDFTTITRSHTTATPLDTAPAVAAVAAGLLDAVDVARGVRLVGVSLSGLTGPVATQMTLPGMGEVETGARRHGDLVPNTGRPPRGLETADLDGKALRLQIAWSEVAGSVDGIRARFGDQAIGTGGNGFRSRVVEHGMWDACERQQRLAEGGVARDA